MTYKYNRQKYDNISDFSPEPPSAPRSTSSHSLKKTTTYSK